MNSKSLIPLILLSAALAGNAMARPEAPVSEAFRSCTPLLDSALARDLMTTVFDVSTRKVFAQKYSSVVTNYRYIDFPKFSQGIAKVDLVSPTLIAGVAPLTLGANTCSDGGCGTQRWHLEFGKISEAQKASLAKWARVAKGDVHPQVWRDKADGTVSMQCDLSGD